MSNKNKNTFERFEKYKKPVAALSILLGGLALNGCTKLDYEGIDNTYVVTGVVEEVNEHSIEIDDSSIVVKEVEGDASDFFKGDGMSEGTKECYATFSDNYCFTTKYYKDDGTIDYELVDADSVLLDQDGNKISIQDVHPGDNVIISGTVHEAKLGIRARDTRVAEVSTLKIID